MTIAASYVSRSWGRQDCEAEGKGSLIKIKLRY